LASDDRVLADPPAQVFVQRLADSGVELVAWPFAKVEDSASLRADLVERARDEFDTAGIAMPYPQQDVHLYTHN
ncbi:MAG TPA: mechanosensitive ion channel family protein, partial [Anaerolineae bacterium]|nr:mechanosensitive ion channel family protein [Anaerolineae bacterium]